MECSQVRKLLFEHPEMDFPADIHDAVELHLAECRGCAARLEALREQMRALRSLPKLSAPAGFLDRLHERTEADTFVKRIRKHASSIMTSGQLLKLAGVATAAVLVLVTFQSVHRDSERPLTLSTESAPPQPPGTALPMTAAGSMLPEKTAQRQNLSESAGRVPAAPHVVRAEAVTLLLRAAGPRITTKSLAAAPERLMRQSAPVPARVEPTEPEETTRSESAPPVSSPVPRDMADKRAVRLQDCISEVTRLVAVAGGKVSAPEASGRTESLMELDVEIPADNYPVLLDNLRALGPISGGQTPGDMPPGSTVHTKVRLTLEDQPRE